MIVRRRLLVAFALILVLLTVGLTGRSLTVADRSDVPRFGGAGPLIKIAPPGPVKPTERGSFTAAEARAYALLGQFDDGVIERLPPLDGETEAAVERMRPLLDRQRLLPGEHRPTVTPNGTFTIAARTPRTSTTAPASAVRTDQRPSNSTPTGGAQEVSAAQVANHLELSQRPGSVDLTADGHVITGRDVWAAIHAEPGRGLPVRITDHGEGGHVVALFGDDVGSLRLNGGLVVPGRYYRIQGAVEITGSAPVNVHIRPLSAVPDYHDGPLQTPSANG